MRLEVSKGGGQNADEFGRDFHHQEREQKPYVASQVPDVDVETAFQKKIGIRKANDTTRKPPKSPLHWVGSSKGAFLQFPDVVKDDMGNALGIAQFGGTAPTAKPWKGLGPGVLEIVEAHEGNAYRAVYTVKFPKAVYVLHAFQKKSPSGVRTAKRVVELVAQRLRLAQEDYKDHYGVPKKKKEANRSFAVLEMCSRTWGIPTRASGRPSCGWPMR
jgi:phage-related protein